MCTGRLERVLQYVQIILAATEEGWLFETLCACMYFQEQKLLLILVPETIHNQKQK